MVLALERSRRVSRDEYDRMIERGLLRGQHVELIHGEILPMAPIGPPHRNAVDLLLSILLPRLLGRARVSAQSPYLAFDDSEPEPDIAVVPLGTYSATHPSIAFLLVEVADSSLDYDRATKGPLYAASNVGEYWIVDVAGRAIEVYREPLDRLFTKTVRIEMGDAAVMRAFPDVEVPVAALFPA